MTEKYVMKFLFLIILFSNLWGCISAEKASEVAGMVAAPNLDRPELISTLGAFSFPDTVVGANNSLVATIVNTKITPAKFNNPPVVNGSALTISINTCSGVTLNQGESCVIGATFAPFSSAAYAGFVTLGYNDLLLNNYSLDYHIPAMV